MSNIEALQELATRATQLGATIKNVVITEKDGFAAVAPAKDNSDFEISIPEDMQLRLSEIDLETMEVKSSSEMIEPLKDFFNDYLKALVDEDDIARIVGIREFAQKEELLTHDAFKALPLGQLLNGSTERAQVIRYILSGYSIVKGGEYVVPPVLSLARQSSGGAAMNVAVSGAFRLTGKASEEIRMTSGRFDSLLALNLLGRGLEFDAAFSLPVGVPITDKKQLSIGRALNETQRLNNGVYPKTQSGSNGHSMTYVPIGIKGRPRVPREIFKVVTKEFSLPRQDENWGQIKSYNLSRLFEAYLEADKLDYDPLKKPLRTALASQIETALESI